MTKMISPESKESTMSRRTDFIGDNKDLKNTEDSCRYVSSSLKRKNEAKCDSPTSSKDSHSDHDSDYDESNGEHTGKSFLFCPSNFRHM